MSESINSERRSRLFNRYFLITVLGVVAAVLALNAAVDPWRLLGDTKFGGGNLLRDNATDRN